MDFETNSSAITHDTTLQTTDEGYQVVAAPAPHQRGWSIAVGVMLLVGIVVAVALVVVGASALAGPRSVRGSITDTTPQMIAPTVTTRDVLPAPPNIDPNIIANTGCINVTTKKAGSSMMVQTTVLRCANGAQYDLAPSLNGFLRACADHDVTSALTYTTGINTFEVTGMFDSRANYGIFKQVVLSSVNIAVTISESGFTNHVAYTQGKIIFTDGSTRNFYGTLVKESGTTSWKIQKITLYR